jgi:hypothetical protein
MFPFFSGSNSSIVSSMNFQLVQQLEKINKQMEFAIQYYQSMDNGAGFSELSILNHEKQLLEQKLSNL